MQFALCKIICSENSGIDLSNNCDCAVVTGGSQFLHTDQESACGENISLIYIKRFLYTEPFLANFNFNF